VLFRKKERTTELVVQAVLKGFRAIDTGKPLALLHMDSNETRSQHASQNTTGECRYQMGDYSAYISNDERREDLVGQALQTLKEEHSIEREDLFIQTKYVRAAHSRDAVLPAHRSGRYTPVSGQDSNQPLPYDPGSPTPDQILQSFQTSLKNLRTTYIDSYLLHSPLTTLSQTIDAWRTLISLRDQGKVRKIGISNVTDVRSLSEMAKEGEIDVVQNRWYERNMWDNKIYSFCMANGIQYQLRSHADLNVRIRECLSVIDNPEHRSFWTLTGTPWLLHDHRVLAIAKAAGCTPAQVIFKLVQMRGITPLSGTTNVTHMVEDLAAEHLQLEPESPDMQILMRLVGGSHEQD
jgi:diketogulonate reductase-like aldo/keto reductase